MVRWVPYLWQKASTMATSWIILVGLCVQICGGTNYDTTHSHESTSSPTAVNITTEKPNPYANKTICYAYVGCFDNFPPFDNANLDLPLSPEAIGTEFLLYTRRNWNNSQHLNYSSLTSITNSFYKSSLKTKIIIHGFTNSIKSTWLYGMKNALLTKDDFNVIIVAWGKGATAPNYNQAVSNTRMVGTQLRLIIDMMVRAGGKVGDMHLIGHSLGAHTAGYTGRLLHGRLGRITGMDPAEPDFEHLSEGIRLDPADANFVDVIHTNGAPISSLGYGLMQASGHVDFYVNGGEKQPGCKNQISGFFGSLLTFNTTAIGEAVACSHGRAHVYFTESILTDCPFTAFPCDSYQNFSRGECMTCGTRGCSQMGYYADQYTARGKMYLVTQSNEHGPYCGFHYVIKYDLGHTDTYGTLSIRLKGTYGQSSLIAITEKDAHLRTSGMVSKLVAVPVEVGDVTSIELFYKKKSGFLFWGGGAKSIEVVSVSVMSGELGDSFSFCVKHSLSDGRAFTAQRQTSPVCK
ncbi:pancreatic lipase-related protein 2-like [Crassostrea angulata]|uniref:pancreatic lipase-related protein 2-like n=1 Tax=Magallana angulata TaxID=2784310 RepID=UPI0022B0D978|nr:pancreatic lipase-related protein 2-like [Crassostrea angulata]